MTVDILDAIAANKRLEGGDALSLLDQAAAEIERQADHIGVLTGELNKFEAQIERLRLALKLHDALAEQDRKSGDDNLWTATYREACEATQSALRQSGNKEG
jgi:hypothetical protein